MRENYSFMLKKVLQLETQKECELFQDSSVYRMCALWTFYESIVLCIAKSAC